ncbi:MAG: Tad domain-containing protein [Candidatus Dormibacteria bacterium]
MLNPQRGNVTLITAMTSLLMVMVVVMATGIGNQTSQATRMQAASDGAAITAAETYIAVINDEVVFDLIDWGLGFIQRLASMLLQIGRAISAIPYVGSVFGAVIQAVANVIKNIAKTAQKAFANIKKSINKLLNAAKQVLATINATMVAANNGYIGFILPTNFLDQAAVTKYNLADIQAITEHALQISDKAHDKATPALIPQIYWGALHNIWGGSGKTPPPASDCGQPGKPACPVSTQELRGGGSADRDTFHLWPDTPGCTSPPAWTDPLTPPADATGTQWHRQCDERLWFKEQVQAWYFEQIQAIHELRIKVNINQKQEADSPERFDGSDQDKTDALKAMDDAEASLRHIAVDTGGETVDQKVKDFIAKIDGYKPTDAPLNHCPKDPNKVAPSGQPTQFGFKCDGQFHADAPDACKTPPPPDPKANPPLPTPDPNPCWAFWGWDKDHAQLVKTGPLDPKLPVDYRDTSTYRDEVEPPGEPTDDAGNLVNSLAEWKKFDHPASVMGADAQTKDVVQDFLEVSEIEPSYMQQLAYHAAGRKDGPTADYAITASKAIVHRADSTKDRLMVADLCDFAKTDDGKNMRDQSGGAVYERIGGPIPLINTLPASVFGWCWVLLGFFDSIVAIYTAIHSFFYDNIINPLRAFKIDLGFLGTICPFCWFATIIAKLVDYVLGPQPPDARNWHIALVSVACVPAVSEVANIAGYVVQAKAKVKNISSSNWDKMLNTVSDTKNLSGFQDVSTCNGPKK